MNLLNKTTLRFYSTRLVSLLKTNVAKKSKKERKNLAIETTVNNLPKIVTKNAIELNLENENKTLLVEGDDNHFYDAVKASLIKHSIIPTDFKLKIESLKPGGQSKSDVINRIKKLNTDEAFKIFGIVDDDGDKDCDNGYHSKNLFRLKRYSKENYVMDPINIYFYILNLNKLTKQPDEIAKFIQSIENEIKFSLGKSYTKYDLTQIVKVIHKNKEYKYNMIKILQIIIDKFEQRLKSLLEKNQNQLFQLLENQKRTAIINLFKSELQFFESKNQSLLKNIQKTDEKFKILNKYYEINERFLQKNFDLRKCTTLNDISENRKKFVLDNLKMDFKKFHRIRTLSQSFLTEYSLKYKTILTETQYPIDLINSLFFNKKIVFINKNKLEYSNLFINCHGHTLEEVIYPFMFTNLKIKCSDIINQFGTNGIIVPDELTTVFRYLSTNIIELDEDNFEHFVFNSKDHYFIKFAVYNHDEPMLNFDSNMIKTY